MYCTGYQKKGKGEEEERRGVSGYNEEALIKFIMEI
jgi:hypothetical protein